MFQTLKGNGKTGATILAGQGETWAIAFDQIVRNNRNTQTQTPLRELVDIEGKIEYRHASMRFGLCTRLQLMTEQSNLETLSTEIDKFALY